MDSVKIVLDSEITKDEITVFQVKHYNSVNGITMTLSYKPSELYINKSLLKAFTVVQRERIAFMAGIEFIRNKDLQLKRLSKNSYSENVNLIISNPLILKKEYIKAINMVSECLDIFDNKQKLLNAFTAHELSELMSIAHKLKTLILVKAID